MMKKVLKVLVVDDDRTVRELVKYLIDSDLGNGVSVVMAVSAEDALREFAEGAPDLVITDLRMETATAGLWLAEKIKVADPGVPVVLVSGEDVGLEDRQNVDQFLHKPFHPDNLVRKVALLLKL